MLLATACLERWVGAADQRTDGSIAMEFVEDVCTRVNGLRNTTEELVWMKVEDTYSNEIKRWGQR